ncbi:MAG: hypothetical protein ACKPA9_25015 [Microcystis sp.]
MRSNSSYLKSLFFGFLLVTVLVYVLRGMGILSFLPGGLILLLILRVKKTIFPCRAIYKLTQSLIGNQKKETLNN